MGTTSEDEMKKALGETAKPAGDAAVDREPSDDVVGKEIRLRYYQWVLRKTPPHRKHHDECCNPKCKGVWGTGCYCCHHGTYAAACASEDVEAYLAAHREAIEPYVRAIGVDAIDDRLAFYESLLRESWKHEHRDGKCCNPQHGRLKGCFCCDGGVFGIGVSNEVMLRACGLDPDWKPVRRNDERPTTATPEERAEMKAALDRFAPPASKAPLTADEAAALHARKLYKDQDHLTLQRSKATTQWTKSSDGTHYYRCVAGLRVDSFGWAHLMGDEWKAGAAKADAISAENFARAAEALGAKPAAPASAPAPDVVPETERDPVERPKPPSIGARLLARFYAWSLDHKAMIWNLLLAAIAVNLILAAVNASSARANRFRVEALAAENEALRTESANLRTDKAALEWAKTQASIDCNLDAIDRNIRVMDCKKNLDRCVEQLFDAVRP